MLFRTTKIAVRSIALLLSFGAIGGLADAQDEPPVFENTQNIPFERPEAWALQRAASLSLFTTLTAPRLREFGSIDLALELGWNPSVSENDRRVGFNGRKTEDLNRLDVVPRPRVMIGIGRGFTLELSYIPPVKIEGLEPNILAAALERPVYQSTKWTLGTRLFGQLGSVDGDITCPKLEATLPPGDPGNEFGCEAPSNDEATMNYAGMAFIAGYRLAKTADASLHFGIYANYMDLEFQVDALTFGIRDRTRLVTDGWTYALTGGFSVPLSSRVGFAFEAFYSPLDVDRPIYDGQGQQTGLDSQDDGLFNLRSMLSYSF